MKVFRRICILLVVVALIAAMPLSAFAASASRTVRYSGYDYDCYAQCGSSTAYASTATECSSSRVRARATVYDADGDPIQALDSGYLYDTGDVYFSSLAAHEKLVSEHFVSDVDGNTKLLTLTVIC